MKDFSHERGSQYVQILLRSCDAGAVTLATSQWTVGESLTAIDKKFVRGEISRGLWQEGMGLVLDRTRSRVEAGNLLLISPSADVIASSWKLIPEKHLSADDALQLFSAIVCGAEAFVAADARLVAAARQSGLRAYNMEEVREATRLLKELGTD